MASAGKRPLKVFLCHASGDKPPVRDLYKRLSAEGVDAWLDKEKLLPGQDWRLEIPRAVQEADVVVVCLSNKSVTKEGYVQKEIKFALDSAEEKPEGTIFLIPARLEDCAVPERLGRWQWVDLYEENGFIQLLRSLKLRADAVGAAVEPTAYEGSDKEIDRRLDQLYTEGLASFYTEDWDKACHRFQSILSEQPNHKNAAEKLAEAERQRNLAKLYAQSTEALRSENWNAAIKALEELTQKSADYKDADSLLKNARRQKHLKELYAEAVKLHAAQKWQAVVKVFEQISAIDSTYSDPNGLLPSAQKEVAELKRLAELNDLYSHAVREMDAGQWVDARRLLEQVHKAQTGFLETERLLRKVEDEIAQVEEQNRRKEQVNVLYEQAHGLLRSKKWRKALDKMEEIQGLDDQFVDKDGISEKAKTEVAREEAEAMREDELSARYAEAVRLLKEEKYQGALDKWQEVKAVDPKYPDRQWVGRTARRKLGMSVRQIPIIQPSLSIQNIGIGWLILLAALGFGLGRLVELNLKGVFRVDLPGELTWGVGGAFQGLIAALVLVRMEKEWKWKSLPIFGVCWAVVYPMVLWVLREGAMLLITSMVFSLAPAVSIVVSTVWTRRVRQGQTYVLIFIGWILAWVIGLSLAEYINPVLHESSLRWIFRDIVAGGIGLWMTVDLLKSKMNEKIADDSDVKVERTRDSANLLLLAFLSFVTLRTIWQFINDRLHIWDVPSPTPAQFIMLFFLGVCFGAVVGFSLKKNILGWRLYHSLIVIAGWAFGFGLATFSINTEYNFDAVLMVISGLSMAGAVKLAKPSISPLKITLIFVFWWAAKMNGAMLGNYLRDNLGTQYAWSFADAVTILLGLLGTFFVLDGDPKRLVKLSLLCALGFGAGNSLSFLSPIWVPLALAVWGFVGGVIFVSLSRDWKKMLIMGGLCGLGLLLGGIITSFLLPDYGNVGNLIWGLGLGIALGLPTRRTSVIMFLAILASATFMMTSIYFSGASLGEPWTSTLRGVLIGLVLGFGYAYATRGLKNDKLAW